MALECRYKCQLCKKKRFYFYSIQEFIASFGLRNLLFYMFKNDYFVVKDICTKCQMPQQPQQQRKRIIYELHHYHYQLQKSPPSYYAELPANSVIP